MDLLVIIFLIHCEKQLQLHIVELNQQFQREMMANQHQNAKDLIYENLVVLHCLTIGIIADLQALQLSCKNYPLLPKLLPSLFRKLKLGSQENQQAIAEIVKLYHQFCEGLTTQPEYNSLVL